MCPAAAFALGWPRTAGEHQLGESRPGAVDGSSWVREARNAPAALRRTEGPARLGLPQDRPPRSPGSAGTGPSSFPAGTGPGSLRVTKNRGGSRSRLRNSYDGSASTHRERGAGPAAERAQPSPPGRGRPARLRWIAMSRGRRRLGKRQQWPSPLRPPLASVSGTCAAPLHR